MAKGAGGRSKEVIKLGGYDTKMVRRKLDLKPASATPIGMLCQLLAKGEETFMEFAHLAVHIEPELAVICEDYDSLSARGQKAVSIDEICVKHQIDPLHFIGVVDVAA